MTKDTSIYNLKALSEKLEISVRTLREYIKRGELTASKIGRAYYVNEPNLTAWMVRKRVEV